MSEIDIWRRLKEHGLSDAGAAGVMGNYFVESRMISYIKQNDKSLNYRESKEFTAAADRGEKNESMTTGGGYGLCQWGDNRKYGLLLFAKERGVSVGDEMLGVDYTIKELQSSEYTNLFKLLKTTDNVTLATKQFCNDFERPNPEYANTAKRIQYANTYFTKYAKSVTPITTVKPIKTTVNANSAITFPVIKLGSSGQIVKILQYALWVYGISCGGIDGAFGDGTLNGLKNFQRNRGIPVTGEVDASTWAKLFGGSIAK